MRVVRGKKPQREPWQGPQRAKLRPQGRAIPIKRNHWWCWGDNQKGKRVILGSFDTEVQAQEQGFTAYPNGCKIYMLNTKSKPRAVSECKARDLREGMTMDRAMRYSYSEKTLRE